jgi:hypothetical protein
MTELFGGQNVDNLFWKCVKNNPSSSKGAVTPSSLLKNKLQTHTSHQSWGETSQIGIKYAKHLVTFVREGLVLITKHCKQVVEHKTSIPKLWGN